MSESATQFTVPAAADTVAAVIGDREFLIQGGRRYTYAQVVERSNRLAAYLHARGLGCKTERSTLGRSRSRPGPAGHLRIQRTRVRRSHARVLAGSGGAVQRQLPLRQERVALPARRLRRDRADLSRDVRAAGQRRASTTSQAARADPDRRRVGQRSRARCRRLRIDRRVGRCRTAAGRAVARRPVRALHRRHDGHAEGRAVAPARHLHDVVRRPEPLHRRACQLLRRHRQTRCGRAGIQADDPAPVDARRGAVGRHDGDDHRSVGGVLHGHRPVRRRRGGPARSSGKRSWR